MAFIDCPSSETVRDGAVIVDEVTTLTGPGELIDVVATERGIAVNPRRTDLLEALERNGTDLPIRPIEEIKRWLAAGGPDRRTWEKMARRTRGKGSDRV